MQKAKEKTLAATDYSTIDAAIIAAAKSLATAATAATARRIALNALYVEDMRSAVSTGSFHVDGRIRSIIKDKTQRALLLSYVYSFEAKLLHSAIKKDVSEKGTISYRLAVCDFDKKAFTLPEKLNDVQRAYVSEVLAISLFRGLVPPFTSEKKALDVEALRTKIAILCEKNGYRLSSELKLTKI